MLTRTEVAAETWRTRHARAGADWAARYWASWLAPHRDVLMHAFDGIRAPERVMEIGANACPNLRRCADRWPTTTLIALDVNAEALAFARRAAKASGWGARLLTYAGDARQVLPCFVDGAADLVFSCYALAYAAPEDLDTLLAAMRRVSTRRLVLMEPHCAGNSRWLGETHPDVHPSGWVHDYPAAIRRLGGTARFAPFTGPDGLNGVTTWEVAA